MLGELLELADDALRAECRAALEALAARITAVRGQVPGDHAEREAILIIEAEPGGPESCVGTLWQMYTRRAERDGRPVRTYHRRMGCFDLLSVTMWIGGAGAFGWLAAERGPHRLDRGSALPALDARVEVLPAAVSFDPVHVPDDEVRVEGFPESRGCGVPYPDGRGSVRLTHLPTQTVAFCEGQGKTHLNRAGAMTVLRARLLHLRRAAPADETEPLPVRHHDGLHLDGRS